MFKKSTDTRGFWPINKKALVEANEISGVAR